MLQWRSEFLPLSKQSFEPIRCLLLDLGADMRRREFLELAGGAAAMWPMTARAQQPAMPTIGYLSPTSLDNVADRLRAFRQGLAEKGYIENRNVAIEFRFAEGRLDRLLELAADLV